MDGDRWSSSYEIWTISIYIYIYTLWLFNIAMENGPFIDDVPIKTSIYEGFSMAMLNNQRVIHIYNVRPPRYLSW